MLRPLKQLAFGSLYLIVLGFIAAGIYYFSSKPTPSCFDNAQNQNEIGVDCGGPCIPCELKDTVLLAEDARYFPAGENQTTFLVKVKNPSQNYGNNFSYEFDVSGDIPFSQFKELKGGSMIGPGATKYIVVPGLPINPRKIRKVEFRITEENWDLEGKAPIYRARITSQTNISQNRVTVTGLLTNESALNLSVVNLTALLFDNEGKILNASITKLEQVEAFGQKQFTIYFPEAEELSRAIDSGKTRVFWEVP